MSVSTPKFFLPKEKVVELRAQMWIAAYAGALASGGADGVNADYASKAADEAVDMLDDRMDEE